MNSQKNFAGSAGVVARVDRSKYRLSAAPEAFQIATWLKRRSDEFAGHSANLTCNGSQESAKQCVRLAMLIEQGHHVLADFRARQIVEGVATIKANRK
jgi:hypothetical protein